MTQEGCSRDELRTLFLFEKLTDAQLDWLSQRGRVEVIPTGPVYAEGDPATHFYVLLDGTVVLSRRVGGDDIAAGRTSQRGVYAGVCDTGPGVPPEIRDRIFEPFFTTKPVGQGTGLGLDITWRIVVKHHGDIAVESVPGDTRFRVRLPVTQANTDHAR